MRTKTTIIETNTLIQTHGLHWDGPARTDPKPFSYYHSEVGPIEILDPVQLPLPSPETEDRVPSIAMPWTPEECPRWLRDVIALDLETSGLVPGLHGTLSIGAVRMLDGAEFYVETRLLGHRLIDMEALAVNGFTVDDATDPAKEPENIGLWRFLEWAGLNENLNAKGDEPRRKVMLAGQNVGKHDFWFLRRMMLDQMDLVDTRNFDGFVLSRTLDLHAMFTLLGVQGVVPVPERGWNSRAIWEAAGLEDEPKPHNALTGARMVAGALVNVDAMRVDVKVRGEK